MSIVNNGVASYIASNNKLVQPAKNTSGEGRTGSTLFYSFSGNTCKGHGEGRKYFAGGEESYIEADANPGTAGALAGTSLNGQTT